MKISFDTDVEVSLFETNIRVLGGLLGGHTAALLVRNDTTNQNLKWYTTELLDLAVILADKLLPAFETETGIPYSRINLKRGITERVRQETNTCTACAGTLILEFGALSRYTNNEIYEKKAKKALLTIFNHRNRHSDLVGSVINVHTGNWIRSDSGVGAGVDSYYEYMLKAYILFGEEEYLENFNIHYNAIKKYMQESDNTAWPYVFLNVEMHKPLQKSRVFLDALLAFWPAMNVLLGDVIDGMAMHEMFNQVIKRYTFLPEAFTPDLKIYWGHHLLRPEFAESTFFLYLATKDPYYLEVAASIVDNLEKYARVDCGYAAIKDVRTLEKFDQMDSFFLAETFKYLYLIFSSDDDIPVDLKDYIFTTEAHLLPISLSMKNRPTQLLHRSVGNFQQCQNLYSLVARRKSLVKLNASERLSIEKFGLDNVYLSTILFNNNQITDNASNDIWEYNNLIRYPLKMFAHQVHPIVSSSQSFQGSQPKFENFNNILDLSFLFKDKANLLNDGNNLDLIQLNNEVQMKMLKSLGIIVRVAKDNRVELVHNPSVAQSRLSASQGMSLIQQLININEFKENEATEDQIKKRHLMLLSPSNLPIISITGWPSQFGIWPQEKIHKDKRVSFISHANFIYGPLVIVEPIDACENVQETGYRSPLVGQFPNIENAPYNPDLMSDIMDNRRHLRNSIAVVLRGNCMFIEKARRLRELGAIGMIVIDNANTGSISTMPPFSMSTDKTENERDDDDNEGSPPTPPITTKLDDPEIPAVFLYNEEANQLLHWMADTYAWQQQKKNDGNFQPDVNVMLSDQKDLELATILRLNNNNNPLKGQQSSSYVIAKVSITQKTLHREEVDPDEIFHFFQITTNDDNNEFHVDMTPEISEKFLQYKDFHQVFDDAHRFLLMADRYNTECRHVFMRLLELAHSYYHHNHLDMDHLYIPKGWQESSSNCFRSYDRKENQKSVKMMTSDSIKLTAIEFSFTIAPKHAKGQLMEIIEIARGR